MKKQLVLTLMALFTVFGTYAQNTNEQKSQGNVSVTQSDDISKLVNGPKKQENTQKQETTTPSTAQGDAQHHATEGGSHATENNSHATEHEKKSDKPKERRREPQEKEKKKQKERNYIEDTSGPVDTSKKVMRGGRKIVGYRVQAFAGGNTRQDRIKAEQVGSELKKRLPSQAVYVHFNTPRWTTRIGNFRKAEHANSLLKTIKKFGYKQACIVKTTITAKHR